MKTCQTCKWWDNHKKTNFGYCDIPDKFMYIGPYKTPIDGVAFWDRIMIKKPKEAQFTTGSDFGCIHHEVRDDNS